MTHFAYYFLLPSTLPQDLRLLWAIAPLHSAYCAPAIDFLQCSVYLVSKLTKRTAERSIIIVPCHANAKPQSITHPVVLVFLPLFHLQNPPPFARCQIELSTLLVTMQVQLSSLQNNLVAISYVLERRPCFITVYVLPGTANTHSVS